ncbi:MAG: hypothetical protein V7K48_08855 [Nostoc sp.]|uniref:hypothetical protein n=1 Tax=Nostoc sp. TaxID=1180 RepID=UPI002FF70ACB
MSDHLYLFIGGFCEGDSTTDCDIIVIILLGDTVSLSYGTLRERGSKLRGVCGREGWLRLRIKYPPRAMPLTTPPMYGVVINNLGLLLSFLIPKCHAKPQFDSYRHCPRLAL